MCFRRNKKVESKVELESNVEPVPNKFGCQLCRKIIPNNCSNDCTVCIKMISQANKRIIIK